MRKLIFVHIPKTAGATFWNYLKNNYGDRLIRDNSKPWRGIIKDKKNYENYDVICGHFQVDKYGYLERSNITFVRDPVERVISEYFFLINSKYYSYENIIEFAKQPQFKNVIYDYVKDLSKFDFIGIQEEFDKSLDKFEKWIGIKISRDFKNYNVNDNNKKLVSKEDRKHIMELNQKDYEIYDEVLKYYE